MKEFKAKEVKNQVVQWIRDWFEENGPGCNAVLGVSGGKDSSVVAALCVEALGKDRVVGVTMPNGVQKDISDSMRLINHLGIRYCKVNIGNTCCTLMATVKEQLWTLESGSRGRSCDPLFVYLFAILNLKSYFCMQPAQIQRKRLRDYAL